MSNQEVMFECPHIEPLLERIACFIDLPALSQVVDEMGGASPNSPAFHARYSLQELITNLNMVDALEGFTADPGLSPQTVIERLDVFGDTLDVCDDVLASLEDDSTGPLAFQSLRTKRAVGDALVANLALYGLFALVAGKAGGAIELAREELS